MEGFRQSCDQEQVTRKRGALGLMVGRISEGWVGGLPGFQDGGLGSDGLVGFCQWCGLE